MRLFKLGTGPLALLASALLCGCAISPIALTPETLAENALDKAQRLTIGQEPITGVIDLHQAMARALKYNLDQKVEIYDAAVRVAELDLAHFNLLPNVVANSGIINRDSAPGASSFNLVTEQPNFGYSTSQDQRVRSSDLTFSWNILDFGLSYVRARQAADKALISEESRRKVVNRLIEDTRTAYWRAYSAQQLVAKLRRLETRTQAALAGSTSVAADRTTSPITALTYRRELLEIRRILQDLQRELSTSKFQLAALMNVKPGTPFTLAAPRLETDGALPADDVAGMVRIALENRPEVHDVMYRQRINQHDAEAALLELLPGLQLFAGSNFDSNSFLLHDQWLSWGAKASWNVIKIFQYPARKNVIEAQDQLLDQRALSLAMAIMTQVHVSRARLLLFRKELAIASAYNANQQDLIASIRSEHAADRISEQTLLREELNAAVAQVRLDIARVSVATAFANLISAMGLDPVDAGIVSQASVAEIATTLKQRSSWRGAPMMLGGK